MAPISLNSEYAAFDMANDELLLVRLKENFGITGQALRWISSYLYLRSFHMQVVLLSSTVISCQTDISRGSVLDPILFTVYVFPSNV